MDQMVSNHLVMDTSAFVALMLDEKDAPAIRTALGQADRVLMSTASRLEACMVLDKIAGFTQDELVRVATEINITWVPFSEEHAVCAFEAFRQYGRGRHKAGLNFGDCQTYATAKLADLPLLYIGSDFGHTDLDSVILS